MMIRLVTVIAFLSVGSAERKSHADFAFRTEYFLPVLFFQFASRLQAKTSNGSSSLPACFSGCFSG